MIIGLFFVHLRLLTYMVGPVKKSYGVNKEGVHALKIYLKSTNEVISRLK